MSPRNAPVAAQQRGREEFFAHYRIEVCEPIRSYEFTSQGGAGTPS
jgi:hypothetical protein